MAIGRRVAGMLTYDPKTRWITDGEGTLIAQVDETAARDPWLGAKLAAGPAAVWLLHKFIGCAEIAHRAPDDKDIERDARALLARIS
jgi:hypothetical protein